MNILVFDIETIPDVAGGRRLYDLPAELSDEDVARAMSAKRRQQTGGNDFLQLPLHRIVAISVVRRSRDDLKVLSLGQSDSTEAELLRQFFKGLEKYCPTLISWNGSGFDLPVLNYRALVHGVKAEQYWQVGDDGGNREFRFNNYLSRYHWRHTDLMDVLAGYQPRANASLNQIATLCGLPGKIGMDGSMVWDTWLQGGIDQIRDYCETDVLNTYLVYLRFQLLRGELNDDEYKAECGVVKDLLTASDKPHLIEFAEHWVHAD